MNLTYYVYIYLNPLKPGNYSYPSLNCSFLYEPFYTGEGKGRRKWSHFTNTLRKIPSLKNSELDNILSCTTISYMKTFVIIYQMTEYKHEAEDIEHNLISIIGRVGKSCDPLTNISGGGKSHRK